MTKTEARKLVDEALDLFLPTAGDIRRRDITILIQDDDEAETEFDGYTEIHTQSGEFVVTFYIYPDTTRERLIRVICHELAHVLTHEVYDIYSTFIDDDGSVASLICRQWFERVAKRIEGYLMDIWDSQEFKSQMMH